MNREARSALCPGKNKEGSAIHVLDFRNSKLHRTLQEYVQCDEILRGCMRIKYFQIDETPNFFIPYNFLKFHTCGSHK